MASREARLTTPYIVGDTTTIVNHFDGVRNLARTNNLNVGINDMIVGVVYGKESELSAH